MSGKTSFIDRLRDRGAVDQYGFLVFATVGMVLIVSAKALGIDGLWVTIGAAVSMALYALIVSRSGTGRLRADQAGDNCYYLGLLYTLASLAYAIFTFDPSDTATAIVQGFGIALVTTILGLTLRVFFNQGRPDLENIEEQTRLELTEAATRVKAQLNGMVGQMSDFNRRMQQSTQETHEAATRVMEEFTKSSTEGLKGVVETANEAIREEARSYANRSKRFSTAFENLLTKLEERGDGVEQLAIAQESVVRSAAVSQETAEKALKTVEALAAVASRASESAQSADEAVSATKAVVDRLVGAVEAVQGNMASIRSETEHQLSALRDGPAQAATEAVESLKESVLELKKHLGQIASLHQVAGEGIASQTNAALEAAKRNNASLSAELERSNGLVTRVHTALAEMTEALAKSVERSV